MSYFDSFVSAVNPFNKKDKERNPVSNLKKTVIDMSRSVIQGAGKSRTVSPEVSGSLKSAMSKLPMDAPTKEEKDLERTEKSRSQLQSFMNTDSKKSSLFESFLDNLDGLPGDVYRIGKHIAKPVFEPQYRKEMLSPSRPARNPEWTDKTFGERIFRPFWAANEKAKGNLSNSNLFNKESIYSGPKDTTVGEFFHSLVGGKYTDILGLGEEDAKNLPPVKHIMDDIISFTDQPFLGVQRYFDNMKDDEMKEFARTGLDILKTSKDAMLMSLVNKKPDDEKGARKIGDLIRGQISGKSSLQADLIREVDKTIEDMKEGKSMFEQSEAGGDKNDYLKWYKNFFGQFPKDALDDGVSKVLGSIKSRMDPKTLSKVYKSASAVMRSKKEGLTIEVEDATQRMEEATALRKELEADMLRPAKEAYKAKWGLQKPKPTEAKITEKTKTNMIAAIGLSGLTAGKVKIDQAKSVVGAAEQVAKQMFPDKGYTQDELLEEFKHGEYYTPDEKLVSIIGLDYGKMSKHTLEAKFKELSAEDKQAVANDVLRKKYEKYQSWKKKMSDKQTADTAEVQRIMMQALDEGKSAEEAKKLAGDKVKEQMFVQSVEKAANTALVGILQGLTRNVAGKGAEWVTGQTLEELAGLDMPIAPAAQKYTGFSDEQYKDFNNKMGEVNQVINLVANLGGSLVLFGGIAGQLSKLIPKLPVVGEFAAARPVFSAYTIQNLGEEGVEAAIAKSTGQEYTFDDFAFGMAMGFGFETLTRAPKAIKAFKDNRVKVMDEVESVVKAAEEAKGSVLTPAEFQKAVAPVKINDQYDIASFYRETALAYKTGKKGEIPGVTTPAPLPIARAAEIPKELEPLRAEAKKYKSAEGFVKSRGTPLYHGTTKDFETFDIGKQLNKEGVYLTSSKEVADQFTHTLTEDLVSQKTGKVMTVYADIKNPKTIDFAKGESLGGERADVARRAKKAGHDALIMKLREGTDEIIVFDPAKVKTESQFIDVWNKARAEIPKAAPKEVEVKREILPWEEGYKTEKAREKFARREPVKVETAEAKQIMDELAVAEAGRRVKNEAGEWSKIESTFPKWIPKDLRKKSLVDGTLKHLEAGTVPKGTKQKELFDIVANKLRPEEVKFRDVTVKEKTRAAIMEKIKSRDVNVKHVKQAIVDFAKKSLDLRERGKLLAAVKNAKTWDDVVNVKAQIMRLGESAESRTARLGIKKELKDIKVRKVKGIPKGRFDADTQAKLDRVKKVVDMDRDLAQRQIYKNLEQYIGENKAVPKEILVENEILGLAGIREMDSVQLKDALGQIKELKSTGRMKAELKRINKDLEMDSFKDDIVDVVTGGKPIEKIRGFDVKDIDKGIRGWARVVDNWQHGWDTFLDKLSKFDKSTSAFNSRLSKFGERVHAARNTQHRGTRVANREIQDKYADIFGAKKKDLRRVVRDQDADKVLGTFRFADGTKQEIKMSQNVAYKKWMEMQDPTLKDTFDAMGWTPEIKKAVTDFMTPQTKEWARWQLEEFYPKYYEGVNKVFRKAYGVDMPFNPKYSPIMRNVDVEIPGDALLIQQAKDYSSITSGSHKSRVKNAKPLKPVSGDEILQKHVMDMEHFKAWAETMGDLRKVFGDADLRKGIEQYHGKHSLQVLDKMINDMAADGVQMGHTIRILDKMRGNFTTSVIGFNPTTFVKQLTSIPAYMAEVPAKDFFAGTTNFWKNPIENYRTLMQSEMMKARYDVGFERDIKQAISQGADKISGKKGWLDKTMILTKLGDRAAIVQGGWSVYKYNLDKLLKKGVPEAKAKAEALRRFEMATKRSQQAGDMEDMAELQRLGSWGKLATMFQTSQNQYYRIASGAVRNLKYGRGSKMENLKKLYVSWSLLPSMFQLTADAFEYRAENQLKANLLGPLNGILWAGNAFSAVASVFSGADRFGGSVTPGPLMAVDDMLDAMDKVVKLVKSEDITPEDVWDTVDEMAEAGSKFVGAPYKPFKTVATGAAELLTGETEDIRRLIYTPYALSGGKKKRPKGVGGEDQGVLDVLEEGRKASATKSEKVTKDAKKAYEEVKRLKAEGDLKGAQKVIDGMDDNVYDKFEKLVKEAKVDPLVKAIRKAPIAARAPAYVEKIRQLKASGEREKAQELIDGMTNKEYEAFADYLASR